MSIQRVSPDDLEVFTLVTNPRRTYASSSVSGVTGNVNLFARRSPVEKEVQPLSPFLDLAHDDADLQSALRNIQASTSSDISGMMSQYLAGVTAQSTSARKAQQLEIVRFEPSVSFTADTQRKNVIKDVLYPYYRHAYPGAHWAYTNYHTLNFFTASSVPSDTALLYPNSSSNASVGSSVSGTYCLRDAFTVQFYINPRYTTDGPFSGFHAGTIVHLSSSYAVSLVTGSSLDTTNRPDGFRLLLQVSGGAEVPPSLVGPSTPLAFLSEDNALRLGRWHHVAIRWSSNVNQGTGSFVVDGQPAGLFVIPGTSIAPAPIVGRGNPDVLVVGNFYEGTNAGNDAQALFFNQNIAQREGLLQLVDDGDDTTNTPDHFRFAHPLNAEVHELQLHDVCRGLDQVSASMSRGTSATGTMVFYVPPFFTRESPNRAPFGSNAVGTLIGGVMQTPFFSIAGTTDTPFNLALSFGVDGHLLNLENFTRDFATGLYPRLLHLSASEIPSEQVPLTADQLLYDEETFFNSGSVRKRNATVLPNDNGLFAPDFSLLVSGGIDDFPASGSLHDRYVNDLGSIDLSLITLDGLVPTGTIFPGLVFDSGSFFDGIVGATPEDPGIEPGSVLTILQRTRDPSSNEVVFFDASDMFYGKRILPGSFSAVDAAVTGTGGRVRITLRDNGRGGLYRADARTPAATWANVGDIFYSEGIVVVKSPNLPMFGTDGFELDFQGEQGIHVLRISTIAAAGEINSSSNPSFLVASASLLAHDADPDFVYLTGLNFHDDDLNVVMKARFSQPITKRSSDRLAVRVRLDF